MAVWVEKRKLHPKSCHAPAATTTTKQETAAVSATVIAAVVGSAVATQAADPTAAAATATARVAIPTAATAAPATEMRRPGKIGSRGEQFWGGYEPIPACKKEATQQVCAPAG
jgi:hypothetical protein